MNASKSLSEATSFGVWTIDSQNLNSKTQSPQEELMKYYFQKSGEYMQGICRFETSFDSMMPLFKSLLRLGGQTWIDVSYSEDNRSAYFLFTQDKAQQVERLFQTMHQLLLKEIKFKSSLKQLILNKKRYQNEQSLLVASLGMKLSG